MSLHDPDHAKLTAYALGELSAAEAEEVRCWLAHSPDAVAEFERVQHTIGLLQDAPPVPRRSLHPRQRDTVLTLGQAPVARAKHEVPYLAYRRPAGTGTRRPSIGWEMAKFAVAACLAVGAFVLGQKSTNRTATLAMENREPLQPMSATTAGRTEVPSATPAPAAAEVASAKAESPAPSAPEVVVRASPQEASKASEPPTPAIVAVAKTAPAPAPTQKSAPTAEEAKPKAPGSITATSNRPLILRGFAQASTAAEAQLLLHPQAVRPLPSKVPHEFAGVVLASPVPLEAKQITAPPPAPRKVESQPALIIHSWKAEIASCPWDASRRLMRFVAQVPVDQPGIESSDRDYKLVAKFDPFQVQAYRLVTEKHMRPSGAGTQAMRFAWYEIVPTRNFNASPDKPVTIGTISIEQPRGTSAPDSTPLKLVDKGMSWSDAREDFVFETAMTGWNMLLEGTENVGALNSKLVLDLAERTRGEDTKGERAKFINAVKQAQRAVGM